MVWGGGMKTVGTVAALLAVVLAPVAGLGTLTGVTAGNTNTAVTNPADLLAAIINLFIPDGVTAGDVTVGDGTGITGVAGSLALLAAALKAPLVALYSISAEVVVMVALILFISYIASLLGIDDFRRRSGVAADDSSFFNDIWNSEFVNGLSERVHRAVDNFDMQEFLERLDTRY